MTQESKGTTMCEANRISDAYPISALFINSCNLDVTEDRIQKIFQMIGIPFQKKLAEMYVMPSSKLNEIVNSVSSAPTSLQAPPAAGVCDSSPAEVLPAGDQKAEEDSEEEEEDIDFGDMFG